MVESHLHADSGNGYLLLTPHLSLSWEGNKTLLWFTGLLLLVTSGGFALTGLWLVLPFAGAELLALGTALYVTSLGRRQREVIVLTDSEVILQRGRERPDHEIRLPRHWSRFVVRECPRDWYPLRLLLCHHNREIEIGSRLSLEEKRELIGHLLRVTNMLPPAGGARRPADRAEDDKHAA